MKPEKILEALTPEIYEKFKTAIEIGKWPDGQELTQQQREICINALIVYEHRHLKPEERTGYLPPKQEECKSESDQVGEESAIKWDK